MEQKFTFYDPHPGFSGASAPLPYAMKKAVDGLDSQMLSLDEVIAKLQPIAENLGGTLKIMEKKKYINFTMKDDGRHLIHIYRLICYK